MLKLPLMPFCRLPVAFAAAGKRFLCASIQAAVQSRERGNLLVDRFRAFLMIGALLPPSPTASSQN